MIPVDQKADGENGEKNTILWWGRSDNQYSRNRIVLKLLQDMGWSVSYFHPRASWLGGIEAAFRRLTKPTLVWVPCFRQRDVVSAWRWCRKWQIPLVFDPLISAFQKEVYEKRTCPPESSKARRIKEWESALFHRADMVVTDTRAHADYFAKIFSLDPGKFTIFPVGAESELFTPKQPPPPGPPFEVLFYGSFLELQGVETIVEAARLCLDLPVVWVLLGEGKLKADMEKQARELSNVRFEPWIPYHDLPGRMAKAHILLGIFGDTPKAGMVVPNKLYQSLAVGRPVITRISAAYPDELATSNTIGWIPPADPEALANMVKQWIAAPDNLVGKGKKSGELFTSHYNDRVMGHMLSSLLEKALLCEKIK
jgi:glycosyltransferase involved in cell wall biosynthesis